MRARFFGLVRTKNGPLLILLAVFAALRIWTGWLSSRVLSEAHVGDVGHWMFAGDQLLRGRVPFADFNGLYGPLLLAWFAAGYRLAGADWFAALLQLEVVSPVLCLLLAYWISGRALKGGGRRALFLAAVAIAGLDHFFWSPALRVWLPLSALVLVQTVLSAKSRRGLTVACLLCGVCPWVSFDTGCALAAGLAVLFAARGRGAGLTRREAGASAAAFAAPSAILAALFPRMFVAFLRTNSGMIALANWCFGIPFPGRPGALAAYCWFAPFVCVAVAAGAALFAVRRARGADERAALFDDLSLSAFAAVSLRTALGRSDYGHLMFCLPAIVLLWVRSCARWGRLAPRAALALAALALLPFAALSATDGDGDLRHLRRLAARGDAPVVDWPEEGLKAPAPFVERARRIADEVRRRVPPEASVLSLPVPLYAHLARRASALPVSSAEQISFVPGGAGSVIAAWEEARVPLVVVDHALELPLSRLDALNAAASSDPLDGRLTWATPADEAMSRELREYLRARYELAAVIDGAAFYSRRDRAAPAPPPARLIAVDAPRALESGRGYLIPVPPVAARELRVDVGCAYVPGLASLAKTYAALGYIELSGAERSAILPVPPAFLGRDLRIPLPNVPLRAVGVAVFSMGAFNPAPRSIALKSLVLVEADVH